VTGVIQEELLWLLFSARISSALAFLIQLDSFTVSMSCSGLYISSSLSFDGVPALQLRQCLKI
jgi:hypothetical protein